ncbi:hypothetical protein CVT24_007184 [Panaeolus cyanescens]|uniref:Dolichol-phosphate mannosyltransferase subunit 3 n=1 Tax=Panaeolus cyanescens TaxID=181874 RepID=A0A409VJE7_9AGAR|nr:hypothetical protein CVT24_007184 [Panaeolus cyanescens]
MARAHRVAFVGALTVIAYLLTLYNVLSIPLVDKEIADEILPVIPWWLLVAFGSYSLWSIGFGLVTLRECPEAYNELLGVSPIFDIRARMSVRVRSLRSSLLDFLFSFDPLHSDYTYVRAKMTLAGFSFYDRLLILLFSSLN